jgi:hypothetical protein
VNTLALNIAGIKVRIKSSTAMARFNDFGFYKDFIVKDSSCFDCRLLHRIGVAPEFAGERDLFQTQNWQLLSVGKKKVLRVGPGTQRNKPDNIVVFERGYREGIIYQKSVFELFRRFIDQFLIINLLSQNKGFLLHSSGVIWKQKGICFTGLSGTGKSTLLNLFKNEVAADCLLNDDRCALRNYGTRWRVFGTPWYGESRVSSSRGADLSAVFFIRHSKRNYVRRLSASQICLSLMVLGLLPLWDYRATARVLATFQNLIQNVPAFELGFVPGKGVVDLIKKTL